MKKLIRMFSILLITALLVACTAVFSACGGEKLDPNVIYITVLDENGSAINGPEFGKGDYDDKTYTVQIQFCTVNATDGGCAAYTADVDANGKAEFPRSAVKELNENDVKVELHVLYVTAKGYLKEYNQYKISEIPQTITITLKKA